MLSAGEMAEIHHRYLHDVAARLPYSAGHNPRQFRRSYQESGRPTPESTSALTMHTMVYRSCTLSSDSQGHSQSEVQQEKREYRPQGGRGMAVAR